MENEIKWSVDQAHSQFEFKVRHMMIAHIKGIFKTFDGNIYTTEKDFTTAVIDLWIDTASVSTGNTQRDEHLIGPDFFDVLNHKQITFVAKTIEKTEEENHHELWGDLTIKGISKHIQLDLEFGGLAKDSWGNEKAGFTITGFINRNDWGLDWNNQLQLGGLLVSEQVAISCDIQLINQGSKDLILDIQTEKDAQVVAIK